MNDTICHTAFFAAWIIWAVCSNLAHGAEPSADTSQASTFLEGVTYGIADGVELKLNIAVPRDDAARPQRHPLLILIHGGGWKTGHRDAYNGQIREAAARGYVAATISHRLTSETDAAGRPRHPWPAAIHDCKAAVRFLKANADRFKIDPNRIGVTGASSGGHLALLLGLTDSSAGLEGDVSMPAQGGDSARNIADTRVHAIFSKAGPTNLTTCYAAPIVTPFLDDLLGPLRDHPELYRSASPSTYVSADDPPVMQIHGDLDQVVPVEQARNLDELLEKAGISHKYVELRGEKHIFSPAGANTYWRELYGFFDHRLGGSTR